MSIKIKFIYIIIVNILFGILIGMGIVGTIFRFEDKNLSIIGALCLLGFLPALVYTISVTKNFYDNTNFRTNFQKRLEDSINYSHFD